MDANDTSKGAPATQAQHRATRYGTVQTKIYLLHDKDRKYFDSGDFALSRATEDSVTGHQETGTEHPRSRGIARLSSPVPSDSNLEMHADTSVRATTTKPTEAHPPSPLTKQLNTLRLENPQRMTTHSSLDSQTKGV